MANITGWGRGTWGEGAWSEALPVEATGVSATGNTGSVTVVCDVVFGVSGLQGTSLLGVLGEGHIGVAGNSATATLGQETVKTDVSIAVTGLQVSASADQGSVVTGTSLVEIVQTEASTGVLGNPLAAGGAIVEEEGLTGTIGFGDEQIVGTANVFPTSASATATSGTISVSGDSVLDVSGVSAIVFTSRPIVDDLAFGVTGLSASGNIGIVFIWGEVIPDQVANWQDISASQTPAWSDILPTQSASWSDIQPSSSATWSDETPSQGANWKEVA